MIPVGEFEKRQIGAKQECQRSTHSLGAYTKTQQQKDKNKKTKTKQKDENKNAKDPLTHREHWARTKTQ